MARQKNTRRADGRYAVQIFLGRDECGKRLYKTVYGATQKEADQKALEVKLSLKKGIDVTSEYDAFAVWAERWLSLKRAEVSHGQYAACASALKHLMPSLGQIPLSKIRAADLQRIILSLAEQNPNTGAPTSVKTLKSIRSCASQIFRLAIENRVIEFNPADAVRIPRTVEPSVRRALTPVEQSWIEQTPHRAQTAAMIMLHAGLRRGELIPLTWSDVDLDARTITINKAVEVIRGKFVVKSTAKNEYSLRVVDIPARLVNYLRLQPRTSVFVCTNARGNMHTESSFTRMWESYLVDLNQKYSDVQSITGGRPSSKFSPSGIVWGIPRFTPHWLRHTYATNLYLSGVDVLTAKMQLGHSRIETTLDIYTHLNRAHQRKSIDKLDAYLGSSTPISTDNQH